MPNSRGVIKYNWDIQFHNIMKIFDTIMKINIVISWSMWLQLFKAKSVYSKHTKQV